ncbi:alpha/beta superfamily hydrolase-like protein [Xylogone sp. PMI_703]|nr:alpha/beta superfamily hydrolase-like protein [Xylogone sp. PMI_703]
MPGLPPNARREQIEDYKHQCSGILWREENTIAADGTRLSLCATTHVSMRTPTLIKHLGNASSIPPRLPFISPVLRILQEKAVNHKRSISYTFVCCSYRGYWKSDGRPSEKGLAKDAEAAMGWIQEHNRRLGHHSRSGRVEDRPIALVLWGQSIGAGVATGLAAQSSVVAGKFSLKALILETPFISVRTMLETLYPQKWLPYRYLWPFLWNHLDSWTALGRLGERSRTADTEPPRILILEAGKDELVPQSHGQMLDQRCRDVGLPVKKVVVRGALHTEAIVRREGQRAVADMIESVTGK